MKTSLISKSLFFAFLASIILSQMELLAPACLSGGVWVNCTILSNSTPINNLINEPKVVIAGFNMYYFLYIAIYLCIAVFLMPQDKSFARFNYITFLGMVIGIGMSQMQLIGSVAVTISVAMFALTLIASMFFR